MRPKKTRWVSCAAGERCFRPLCKRHGDLKGVHLTLDEFEALRLADYERLQQDEIALNMKVHRSTVSRILASARRKVADALIHMKAIRIEGGCCKVVGGRKK